MIVDVEKVIAVALADVGRGEATGRNDGPWIEAILGEPTPPSGVGQPWCAAAVMRWYERAGYPFARLGREPAWMVPFWACRAVATLFAELTERGCRVGEGDRIEPGDLCVMLGAGAANAGATGHVELVTAVERSPDAVVVRCVGGNVGNAVRRTQRRAFASEVSGYVRPRRLIEAHTP